MMLLFALFIATATAHNWVNSPSRSVNANPVKPSGPSETGQPHLQAIAGQKFQIEWVTGHDSYVYWVLLKAKDKESLLKQSDKILNDYLDNAPAAMQKPPAVEWQKFHRKYNDDTLDNKKGTGDGMFVKCHKPGDPHYIERPESFDGHMSPGGNPKADNFDPKLAYTCQYKQTEACHSGDRRAIYKNDKYPYIIGVHRYRICAGYGARPDVAMFAFPVGTKPGNYFVQYNWRGYYDIVDVRIVAGTTPLPKTYGDRPKLLPKGTPAEYRRIDHCAFPQAESIKACVRMKSDYSIGSCKTMCEWTTIIGCTGIAVYPLVWPDTVYKHFRNVSFIPYDISNERKCPKATLHKDAKPGEKVCFPALAREATQTAGRYVVSDDPEDPIFYSTCYVRVRKVVLEPPPGAENMEMEEEEEEEEEDGVTEAPEFMFRERCISCEAQKRATFELSTPSQLDFVPQEKCIHCDIDGPGIETYSKPVNKSVPIKFKAIHTRKECNNERPEASKPDKVLRSTFTCENKATNCVKSFGYPGSGRAADIDPHDCREMIKADPDCSKQYVMSTRKTDFFATRCVCWRVNPSCCGPCTLQADGNWITYEY